MARIFITGSTDGLGFAAARTLGSEGHDVVLHARSEARAAGLSRSLGRSVPIVVGDLADAAETRAVAEQVNALGRMDAVIHNAGIYLAPERGSTPEGHPTTLAVNTLAPYILTVLIERPDRLIYLSSGLHRSGEGSLRDIEWNDRSWDAGRAYSESKLHLAALAAALARRWPDVLSNAVDPGWVPTRMGGPGATDDLELGHLTQTWLATSDAAAAMVRGGYWHHRERQDPAREVVDPDFQDRLLETLATLTGTRLP
ncbi:SDR family NAD(P)-dependent oxidoreductase [Aurantimonas sp. Leaf443]|uniref:SDR family NAD(P)-dependent oxidoreductase n=1 Tax=Aurantimonas sp. Leaf443 TaxID=1736378 RepID=UPI0006F488CA|nr:SDR family NAD(P)-dependent oxidoreductase [Aurantimonas sp. Leaf443]KQT86851.1 daunorubicin C-13 ketoreductase [Aurantimonas sp. Leaf443]